MATPPGWYPNKKPGVLQYWDGQQWTSQFKAANPNAPSGITKLLDGVRQAAQTPNQRLLLILLGGILAVLVVIAIVLLSTKPWESQAYKNCVAEQKAQAGGSSNVNSQLESAIEEYCHNNYD
jgi:hypothetical protein